MKVKVVWCFAAMMLSSQLWSDSIKVQMLEGEQWWGLASGKGPNQP
jgi:hypothetical protein